MSRLSGRPPARFDTPNESLPDWANSPDFLQFEREADGRAPSLERAVYPEPRTDAERALGAGEDDGLRIAVQAGKPSRRELWNQYIAERYHLTPEEGARLSAMGNAYGRRHPLDWATAATIYINEKGTITPAQDQATRRFFESIQGDPLGRKALEEYKKALATGELKLLK